jgi:WD40 repeat protein
VAWLACSDRGSTLLTLDRSGLFRARDPFEPSDLGAWQFTRADLVAGVDTLAADPDATRVVTRQRLSFSVRNSLDGSLVFSMTLPAGQHVTRAALARARPDGSQPLLALHGDSTVRLWDASTGRMLAERPYEGGAAASLALSANGRYLALADGQGKIALWNAERLELERDLLSPPYDTPTTTIPLTSVVALDFAHGDVPMLAAAFSQGFVRLWDPAGGRVLATLAMPARAAPTRLAWSADGRYLAVTVRGDFGEIRQVHVWDARTVQPIAQRPLNDTFASGLFDFCSDRKRPVLAALHGDQIELWDVP